MPVYPHPRELGFVLEPDQRTYRDLSVVLSEISPRLSQTLKKPSCMSGTEIDADREEPSKKDHDLT